MCLVLVALDAGRLYRACEYTVQVISASEGIFLFASVTLAVLQSRVILTSPLLLDSIPLPPQATQEKRPDTQHEEQQQQQPQTQAQSPRDLQDSDVIGYIIGGNQVTNADRYKYAVSLTKWGGHFCGGALIAPDLVISAAHCQNIDGAKVGLINKNDGAPNFPVFTGITGVTRSTQCDSGISSKGIHIHEAYGDNYVNDVMIVKLGGSVDTSVYPTITINTDDTVPSSGDSLTTMGWGQTIAGSSTSMSNVLKEVEVKYVSQTTCRNMYGGYLQDNMLCAMDPGRTPAKATLVAHSSSLGADPLPIASSASCRGGMVAQVPPTLESIRD